MFSSSFVRYVVAFFLSATLMTAGSNIAAASPAGAGASSARENIAIALDFVDRSGDFPTFDRKAAVQAGLDRDFAKSFYQGFTKAVENRKQSSSATSEDTAGMSPMLFPAWFNCALAIAGYAGVAVGAIAGAFTGGATLPAVLATYGIASASVVGSCYDKNGNPVIG